MNMISTYSVRIFRNLVSRWPLRSIPENGTIRATNLRWYSQPMTSMLQRNGKLNIEGNIRKAIKLLKGHPNIESIKWKEMEEELKELDVLHPRQAIFQACLRLKALEAGISYFNHVNKNGGDFKTTELVFFLKLIATQRESIKKYESEVKHAYNKIKVYVGSAVIQNFLLKMISEIPEFFDLLVKNICKDKKSFSGLYIINKALELKNIDLAVEMMNSLQININLVFDSYIKCLCHMVMENKFSVDMITTLIKYCEDNNNIISNKNYLTFSTTFFNTLKQYDKNYEWTLNKCYVNESSICSNCGKKLVDKCISESDFKTLKEAFLPKAGLIEQNIFLNTTDAEIKNFLEFLNNTKPYQMVVDGLNLMYKNKKFSNILSRPIKYFLDKQMNMLIIARKHAKNEILRMSFLKKKQYRNSCQFFFTDNLSDDDLFTLYAALHAGLRTYFISGDFLQKYGSRFDISIKRIYFKWKSYHQYVFDTEIFSPIPTLGLSQLTSNENGKKITWHISNDNEKYNNDLLGPKPYLKWACLQAEKKSP